ncbi:MAG TPA: YdcH family protein [Burkholderiales bacterium]
MLTADDIEAIQTRIVELQTEHRDLDAVIQRVSDTAGHDELLMRRLKKRKLQLKDSITLLQMRLIPDIPA